MKKEKIHTVKTVLSIIMILAVLALGVWYVLDKYFLVEKQSGGTYKPVTLTPENLPSYLSSQSLIKDLPEDASVQISIGEQTYGIEGNNVKNEGLSDPDLIISLPDNYYKVIGDKGLCGAIKQANSNKELNIQYGKSSGSLAWKYKGLLKYKECLG